MNWKARVFMLANSLLFLGTTAMACDYTAGETKFIDYANCRYGEESIQVVHLENNSSWDECVYHVEAFRPAKLLAVTKSKDGQELLSVNNRSDIGNPCYMTKRSCDAAFQAAQN